MFPLPILNQEPNNTGKLSKQQARKKPKIFC